MNTARKMAPGTFGVGKTRLVFASSSSVYGSAERLPTPEIHPCHPKSPYALATLHGEQWCGMFHRLYGLDVVSLRYFNVFGPGARFGGAYSTVLSAWLYYLHVEQSSPAYLEGDGTQSRDFCFVDNVVQANIAAATRERGFAAEVLNVGQGHAHSLLEVKDALEQIAGRSWGSIRRPTFTPNSPARQPGIATATRRRAGRPEVRGHKY